MQNSEQFSGTRSRGTLTRGARATFHALWSNRIRLCRSTVYQERHVRQALILLLTCATTRALHLELSSDMSVDKFLMALDRFISRRGLPTLSTPITPLHSKQPVENWLRYVPFWTTHRHPTTSHIEASHGNLLPHGRLGGEDGGSVW
jgi:hypothetical protein